MDKHHTEYADEQDPAGRIAFGIDWMEGNLAERSMMRLPDYAWQNEPEINWDEIEALDMRSAEQHVAEASFALSTTLRLLNDDAVAATMVAATINTRQAAGESGPAFVKRIVRSWLEEMSR